MKRESSGSLCTIFGGRSQQILRAALQCVTWWSVLWRKTKQAEGCRDCGGAVGVWMGLLLPPWPRPLNALTPPSRPLFPDLQFLLFLLDHTFPSAIAYKSCSPDTFAWPLMSPPFQSGTWVWIPAVVWPLQSCPWECSGSVLLAASSCYRFRCSQQPCGRLLGPRLLHGRVGWCSLAASRQCVTHHVVWRRVCIWLCVSYARRQHGFRDGPFPSPLLSGCVPE